LRPVNATFLHPTTWLPVAIAVLVAVTGVYVDKPTNSSNV
jgi:hypothetical protein